MSPEFQEFQEFQNFHQWSAELAKEQLPKPERSAKRRGQQTILQRIDWTLPVLDSRVGG